MKIMTSLLIGIVVFLSPLQAGEKQKTPMQKQLQSISPLLQVTDMKKSVEFYTGKLGFKEKWRDGDGFVILSRDGCDLYLGQKQTKVDLRNITARAKPDGFASYDLHIHCALGAVDSLWKEFTRAGVQIPEKNGPVNREYGIRDFTVIDPDGYSIVFGSPTE
jgi:catechol 2,3-dioxygenase-like lactoylglutathione lyase family enzyme